MTPRTPSPTQRSGPDAPAALRRPRTERHAWGGWAPPTVFSALGCFHNGRCLLVCALALLLACGCGRTSSTPSAPATPTFPGVTLRVGAITAPGLSPATVLEPISAQRGEWAATRGAQVEMLTDRPLEPATAASAADVLVLPADQLGNLVQAGALAPWPADRLRPPRTSVDDVADPSNPPPPPDDPFEYSDIIPDVRDRVIRFAGEIVALPLGSSALVLVYRRDVLENETLKAAAQQAGIPLAVPETYDRLDALARFLHNRDWNGDGQPDAAIALALGNDPEGVADAVFLARAAALGLHPDYFSLGFDERTLAPRIASPPFVDALAALAALAKLGPDRAVDFNADQAREAFRAGKVALLIDRAERAAAWSDPKRPVRTGVAPLPGSPRVFDPHRRAWQDLDRPNRPTYLLHGGGWLIAVSANSSHPEAAFDFVKTLLDPETADRLVSDRDFPLLPVRTSQSGTDRVDPRQDIRGWGRAVSRTLAANRLAVGLRLPAAADYLADLATARRAAVDGSRSPQDALDAAAGAWQRRSKALGTERQLWFERASLNVRTSEAEPPPPPAK